MLWGTYALASWLVSYSYRVLPIAPLHDYRCAYTRCHKIRANRHTPDSPQRLYADRLEPWPTANASSLRGSELSISLVDPSLAAPIRTLVAGNRGTALADLQPAAACCERSYDYAPATMAPLIRNNRNR